VTARVRLSACPACDGVALTPVERVRGFELIRCNRCGLEFTANPQRGIEKYSEVYSGRGAFLDDTRPYFGPATRLALEVDAYLRPRPYLTSAEKWVLRKLSTNVPKGAVILDIGCGAGRFLAVLRREGYRPVGIDPVPAMIKMLAMRGFHVSLGAVPGINWDGPEPAAVVMFEVLEHLQDPVSALREIHERFPSAFFGASVPSPIRAGLERGIRGESDYPPNHYLRWTPESLQFALKRAGYSGVEVIAPKPQSVEFAPGASRLLPESALRALGRAGSRSNFAAPTGVRGARDLRSPSGARRGYATGLLFAHYVSRSISSALGTPRAIRARRQGRSGVSLGIWACTS
jgi:SAM-dependent methyltransferase